MNEITIHGNVVTDPEARTVREGMALTTFRMAIRRRRYDQAKGGWIDLPSVFQDVVAFNGLARNAADTLTKGITVTVTGELVDNSYTPNGANYRVARTQVVAADIAVSLRWATAVVTRNPRPQQSAEPVEASAEAAEPTEAPAATSERAEPRKAAATAKRTKATKAAQPSPA
ncbi:MAG TPA: single-stranded DNA-binding protein [Mycobacteriales bacterium]|nr:single-stranded DNA-binding protein [Mycobacteriales bacterium]